MILSDLLLVVTILITVLIECLTDARHTKPTKGCPQGCSTCSTYNGCFACRPHYYFLLHRSGMRQIGVCTHACPTGYYHNRGSDYYKCSRCRITNCARCYDRDICALCEPPYLSYEGRCVVSCPSNMYADANTGDCKAKVNCSVSSWSTWSACEKNGRTCGYKWGTERRSREIEVHPTPGGAPCPDLTEERRCRVKVRYCPGTARKTPKSNRKKVNSTHRRPGADGSSRHQQILTKAQRRRRRKKLKSSLRNNEVELVT